MGKANIILVLFFLSFVSVAAPPVPRGRPRLNASRTTFVAENGNLLRGAVIRHDRAALEAAKAHGLNAVHDYAEGCDLKYPAEGSRAPGYRVETIDKAVKLTRELGLYYVMVIGNDPGTFNEKWALDFWTFYAKRYADEPHVIFEIMNEPVKWAPPYASDHANPRGAVELNAKCWKTIRELAPKSPILIFSYSQLPWGAGKDVLADVKKFNELVGLDEKTIWENTAIAFHGYSGAHPTECAVKDVLKAGYPMFMTEYYSSRWDGPEEPGRNDCELTGQLEEDRVSWLSFLYLPPGMWGLNIADDRCLRTPTERAGITWTPDFGDWPKARRLIKDATGRAFEVGVWKDGRIGGKTELKPTRAKTDEFVLRVREPGYYSLSLEYAKGGGSAVDVTYLDVDLAHWKLDAAGTKVRKTVFLEPGRGVLKVVRSKVGSVLQRITLEPCERGPLTNGVYRIVGRASGLSLAAKDGVRQMAWADDKAQRWEFTNLGAGQYLVVNKEAGGVLNRIFFGSDKVNLVWYGWQAPSGDQRWILRPADRGYVRISPVATGRDVQIRTPDVRGELQQGSGRFDGERFRQWKIVPPETVPKKEPAVATSSDGKNRWRGGRSGEWGNAFFWEGGIPSEESVVRFERDACVKLTGDVKVARVEIARGATVVFETPDIWSRFPSLKAGSVVGDGTLCLHRTGFLGCGDEAAIACGRLEVRNVWKPEDDVRNGLDSWLGTERGDGKLVVKSPVVGAGYLVVRGHVAFSADNRGFAGTVRPEGDKVAFQGQKSKFAHIR